METNTEQQDALIDRYLKHQLNVVEHAAFEIQMMDDPLLLERVQLLDALQQGLRAQANALLAGGTTNKSGSVLSFTAWLRQPLSLAASVLVAVLGLQMLYPGFLPRQGSAEKSVSAGNRASGLAIGSVLRLESSRGNTPVQFIGAPPYLFQIDAGLGNQPDMFTLTLRNATNNEIVLKQGGLHADADGWVSLVLMEALTGEYAVELGWLDQGGAPQTRIFSINLTP